LSPSCYGLAPYAFPITSKYVGMQLFCDAILLDVTLATILVSVRGLIGMLSVKAAGYCFFIDAALACFLRLSKTIISSAQFESECYFTASGFTKVFTTKQRGGGSA
jgi:hypothetical protein